MNSISLTLSLIIGLSLVGFNANASTPAPTIEVNTDISTFCYFTVNRFQRGEDITFKIISSSPRDCGEVDEKTGRVLESKVNLYCPRGYEQIGIPRGGPTGSFGDDIYYQAQGLCRATYFLPVTNLTIPGIPQ